MTIRLEKWYTLDLDEEVKKYLSSQLFLVSTTWNGLLTHFIDYVKREEQIDLDLEAIKTIANYIANTTRHNYSVKHSLCDSLVHSVSVRFLYTIHSLYTNTINNSAPLVKINVYEPIYIYKEDINVDRDRNMLQICDKYLIFKDEVQIPNSFLFIKLKYTLNEKDNIESFQVCFV